MQEEGRLWVLQDSGKTLSDCHHSDSGGGREKWEKRDGFQTQRSGQDALDGFQTQRSLGGRMRCELEGGRFENDSKDFGRMKLPSTEMGKAEEGDFTQEIRNYNFHIQI